MDVDERIMKTVAYFDLFDYPLTRAEIRRWLYADKDGTASSRGENDPVLVSDAISRLISRGTLKEDSGYICAADREGLSAIREERFRHSLRKMRRARRWARVFGALPGVKMVGIGNTLAYGNAKDGSDIDFFIVTEPGTIWRTRFFAAGVAAFFGLRPKAGVSRDRLCLSFFVTSDNQDISAIAANDGSFEDIYLHYWMRQMVPLCGSLETADMYRASNGGIAPRGMPVKAGMLSRVFGSLRRLPGDFLKKAQISHFPQAIKAAASKNDGSVMVSDTVLKFHVNDRRREVYDKWVKRLESLLPERAATAR
jgi:hypothetical protein